MGGKKIDLKGADADKAREILSFIREEPKAWQTPTGEMLASESNKRRGLAEKYLSERTLNWMQAQGFDLETVVESTAGIGRFEFCELLSGAALEVPAESGPGVDIFGGRKM